MMDLIVNSSHVLRLVQVNAIRPLNGAINADTRAQFMGDTLMVLEVEDDLYGLPLTVDTTVLFYNIRRTQRAVANENLRINSRLNPTTSVMAAPARNAVPLPNIPRRVAVFTAVDTAQIRVLEGVLAPAEAAVDTTRALNEQLGFEEMELPV